MAGTKMLGKKCFVIFQSSSFASCHRGINKLHNKTQKTIQFKRNKIIRATNTRVGPRISKKDDYILHNQEKYDIIILTLKKGEAYA